MKSERESTGVPVSPVAPSTKIRSPSRHLEEGQASSRIPQGPPSVSNHLAQRRAAEALLNRIKVTVTRRTFAADKPMIARVLVDDEYYDVIKAELEDLEEGMTPEELQLDPVDCEEEEDC